MRARGAPLHRYDNGAWCNDLMGHRFVQNTSEVSQVIEQVEDIRTTYIALCIIKHYIWVLSEKELMI